MKNSVRVGQGDDAIEIPYRFSTRAKHISIRIVGHSAELVIPKHIGLNRALIFLSGKLGWIKSSLEEKPEELVIENGAIIPVMGEELEIFYTGSRAGITHIEGKQIRVYSKPEAVSASTRHLLDKVLKEKAEGIAQTKADMLGVKFKSIKIKKLGTMWGNCSADGKMNFSSTLIHAPLEVLEYIVSHEVAHLKEMNHSKKFWKLVYELMPDCDVWRKWLKENTARLSAVRI